MRHLLYLTGRPGAGKSTLAAALTAGLPSFVDRRPFAHVLFHSCSPPVAALGAPRDGFPGTDTLPMNVVTAVRAWLPTVPFDVLGEGDRLATAGFLDGCREMGLSVCHVHLDLDDANAEARLATRTEWSPSSAWLAGRVTKARRLGERADLVLDASLPTAELAVAVREASPVAAALAAAQEALAGS